MTIPNKNKYLEDNTVNNVAYITSLKIKDLHETDPKLWLE